MKGGLMLEHLYHAQSLAFEEASIENAVTHVLEQLCHVTKAQWGWVSACDLLPTGTAQFRTVATAESENTTEYDCIGFSQALQSSLGWDQNGNTAWISIHNGITLGGDVKISVDSLAVLPLMRKKEKIGILVLTRESNPWTEEELSQYKLVYELLARLIHWDRSRRNQREEHVRRRESEDRIKLILRSATECIMLVSEDGYVESINPAGEEMFQAQPGELVGVHVEQLIPCLMNRLGDHRQPDSRISGKLLVRVQNSRFFGVRQDGTSIPLEVSFSETHSQKGIQYVGVIRDISLQVAAEQAADLEAKHRSLAVNLGLILAQETEIPPMIQRCADEILEHTNAVAVWIWIADVSTSDWRLLGRATNSEWELLQKLPNVCKPWGGTRPTFLQEVAWRSVVLAPSETGEYGSVVEDPTIDRLIEFPMGGTAEQIGVICLLVDTPLVESSKRLLGSITDNIAVHVERRRVEFSRRTNEERIKKLIDTAHDAVISFDENGVIFEWNRQAERIFGWTSEESMGQDVRSLIIPAPERADYLDRLVKLALNEDHTAEETRVEITAVRKSGEEFPAEHSVGAIRSGEALTFSVFLRDISAQKRQQDELRHAKEAAETSSAAKSTFLANISHEMRTPLAGILGHVEMLEDASLPKGAAAFRVS